MKGCGTIMNEDGFIMERAAAATVPEEASFGTIIGTIIMI